MLELDPIIHDPRVKSAANSHPQPPLFVTVSGAHLYGFASPDSDVDLRGAHLAPLRELVGLFPPRETIEISQVREGLEWDIVTHEVRKFSALLVKSSGYALEQLLSPLIVLARPGHAELCHIARQGINRRYARHYLGFASTQWRLFQKETPPRVKPLLYIFRVLLTGIRLMQRGELEANLRVLNEEFASPVITDLIALKTGTQEKVTLPVADMPYFRAEYERLCTLLQESASQSPLPAQTDIAPALHDWLLKLRFAEE